MNGIKEKLWTRDYSLLLIMSLGAGCLNSFFLSTLPIYAERISGSATFAGMVSGIYALSALTSRPFVGVACEKFNQRKMLLIGITMMTLTCFLYNWAYTIVILLFLRALHGIGFGTKTTVSGVMIAEIIPQSRFKEGLSIYGLYLPITNAIAPAIGLAIVGNGELKNFNHLFILATVIGIASIILASQIKLKRTGDSSSDIEKKLYVQSKTEQQKEKKLLPKTFCGFEAGVIFPSLVLCLVYIGQGGILSFLPMCYIDKGWGSCGSFFLVNAAALFLSRLIFAKIVSKIDYDILMVAAVVVFGFGVLAIPYVTSIVYVYGIAVLLGFAMGIIPMIVNILVLERCSAQRKGTAIAAYTSSMDIGVGVGSMLLGLILEFSNYKTIYMCAAGFALVAAVIYALTLWGDKKIMHFDRMDQINN